MSHIIESRVLTIENRIIDLKIVRDMASVLREIYDANVPDCNSYDSRSLQFRVESSDNSVFSGSELSIFDEDSIINTKRIVNIKLSYSDFTKKDDVAIAINHEAGTYVYSSHNTISVTGNNSLWVNGTIARLKDIIDSAKPQTTVFKKYYFLMYLPLSIAIGIVLVPILIQLILVFIPPSEMKPSAYSAIKDFKNHSSKYFVYCLFGAIPTLFAEISIRKLVHSLWPFIEIQIGPEHSLIEKSRRKALLGFATLIILPIGSSIIYDIIKGLL